jgi:hypothetical protein
VVAQVWRQLVHRHPVDAWTALIATHALERACEITTLDDHRHQIIVSRVGGSVGRWAGFTAPLTRQGFTPRREW